MSNVAKRLEQYILILPVFLSCFIQGILNLYGYHIDSLLQLSEVCKMAEDYQMAAELVGRLFLINDQGSVVRDADNAIDWVVVFRWSQNDIKNNDTRHIELARERKGL